MAQRWRDWLAQAEHDLEQAAASRRDGHHDWACFAAHQAAENALRAWALAQSETRPELRALGYFGSHARGDAGFGSDLDVVAIVQRSALPFIGRGSDWPTCTLPVPVDLLVYTADEWRTLQEDGGRFAVTLAKETVWVVGRPA